jgi:hypothetical protein
MTLMGSPRVKNEVFAFCYFSDDSKTSLFQVSNDPFDFWREIVCPPLTYDLSKWSVEVNFKNFQKVLELSKTSRNGKISF